MKAVQTKSDITEVIARDVHPITVDTDARAYSRLGWLVVLAGVGGFFLWALFAPLDKGVPMQGTVMKESNRQAVQFQQGGTVEAILVKDGDVVKAGQTVVKMNRIMAKSAADMSHSQYLSGLATEARLIAERDNLKKVVFPPELANSKEPRALELMALQNQLFSSRQSSLQNELGGIDENIAGLKLTIASQKETNENNKAQLGFVTEQLTGMRDLAKDGYVARNRLLEVERQRAQIAGGLSESLGAIGRGQRQLAELSLRKMQRQQDYQKEVRTQLSDLQKEIEALKSRITAQDFEVSTADVKAPADGTVVGLAVFTPGGVVGPGFRLMDIVPSDDPLVVEGHLAVNLIDKVHVGLPVELSLSAFNTNKTPHIPGEVTQVSADRTVNERTGEPYYTVRVKVTPAGQKLITEHKLAVRSGMPVDLFVKTGERTMMNYLFRPLMDRFKSSMSED